MKKGKIGMEGLAIGRLGNHLFQYNFLTQISKHLDLEMFHRTFLGNQYFENLDRRSFPLSHFPGRSIRYSKQEIESMPWDSFIDAVKSNTSSGKNVVIPPGIMGNRFFDAIYLDPREIFQLKSESLDLSAKFENDAKIRIGIHFRGQDYAAWDKEAVMDASYYSSALDYLSTVVDFKDVDLQLITDDPNHDTCREITRYWNVKYGSFENPQSDFFNLSQCDYLISSPSSFVFWASALGREKKVIYSKRWVDYKIEKGDIYWTKLRAGVSPLFGIYKEF